MKTLLESLITRKNLKSVGPDIPDFVDLGLSVKWATCNLGAMSPEEEGKYYAWADNTGHYRKENYDFSPRNEPYSKYSGTDYSRYCKKDKLVKLKPEDDAVTEEFGKGHRIPTVNEFVELIKNTKHVEKGKGILVTSKINSEQIYMPYFSCVIGTDYGDSFGEYWTSELAPYEGLFDRAYATFFNHGSFLSPKDSSRRTRYLGMQIRGVEEF